MDHLDPIRKWTARYHDRAAAAMAAPDRWVTTHGEPHTGTASDDVAFAGLIEELSRAQWSMP